MRVISAIVLLLVSWCSVGQSEDWTAFSFMVSDEQLGPFQHGVASGDPLHDRVIIWTRVTPPGLIPEIAVEWRIAEDPDLNDVIDEGMIFTTPDRDYTVKIDVGGLEPGKWYYYGFIYSNFKSLTGRTRTLPEGWGADSLRFAVLSCQNYPSGYYHVYDHLAKRNDLDAVFHLGDFIYEYGQGFSPVGQLNVPPHETVTLEDYRIRYSLYLKNRALRSALQQYPFICIWDDHEITNDAWKDGAQNHTEGVEGFYTDRKQVAARVFHEWLPVRMSDDEDLFRIYRNFEWGKLVETYFAETRLLARDMQVQGVFPALNQPVFQDTSRRIMGLEQMEWLREGMVNSQARWQFLAEPVMVAPLYIDTVAPRRIFGSDLWDGYPFERKRLYDLVLDNQIENFVVLSGDMHSSWANELHYGDWNPQSVPLGVEFVTPGVTSPNQTFPPGMLSINPHVKWSNLNGNGFMIVDVNQSRVQTDWYFVSSVIQPQYFITCGKSFRVNHLSPFPSEVTGCVSYIRKYPPLAPYQPDQEAGIFAEAGKEPILKVYPNPAGELVHAEFYLQAPDEVGWELKDMSGSTLAFQGVNYFLEGWNRISIPVAELPAGQYLLILSGRGYTANSFILKAY